jgi:hypothetical protein
MERMTTDKPTLLVLGAGASSAYGFPLGHKLRRSIVASATGNKDHADKIALASNKSRDAVHQFGLELQQSRRSSIDAFIESRAHDYDEIGRCAIARELLGVESDNGLFPKVNVDWYSSLFDAILGNSSDAFRRNQLKVLTFNFDRSFERALYLALEANFKGQDIDQLLDVVPVHHVHGDLGLPSWRARYRNVNDRRPYTPADDRESIAMCAQRMKIVHHPVHSETSETIREWFEWSRRVFFIGFSYHELNLKKLNVPACLIGKTAYGTAYGMEAGLRERVIRLTNNNQGPMLARHAFDYTAIQAIERTDWFYES